MKWPKRGPKPSGRVHDYRKRCWGHDYVWTPDQGSEGRKGLAHGWGPAFGSRPHPPGELLSLMGDRIVAGDLLIFKGQNGGMALYRVAAVTYMQDPEDMWRARLHYDDKPTEDEMGHLRSMVES